MPVPPPPPPDLSGVLVALHDRLAEIDAVLLRVDQRGAELEARVLEAELRAAIAGATAMREACLAVVRPLGTYDNTPAMQARLQTRIELTNQILDIDGAALLGRQDWRSTISVSCLKEPAP